MSRDWLAVHGSILTRPKYKRLSPIGRGALLHTFILACYRSPEAMWDDPEELRETLVLDGFPAGVLDELVGLGWLDPEDGALVIHDWDEHQYAASKVAQCEWEAKRKREWRKHRTPSPAPLTPKREDKRREDSVRDMSRDGTDMSRTPTPRRGRSNPVSIADAMTSAVGAQGKPKPERELTHGTPRRLSRPRSGAGSG